MENEDIERRAALILGYFNQEAVDKIVRFVLETDTKGRAAFAKIVYDKIPELFDEELKRVVRGYMSSVLTDIAKSGEFWKRAEPLIRAAMERHVEQVVDELAKTELRSMARDAIRAQLRKGL